jgi:dipeptidyl aminopeptidase/acylaminoacyl peptidase
MRAVLPLCLLASLSAACAGRQTVPTVAWRPRQGPSLEQLLNVHRAFGPSAAPDGQSLAFLSDASGLPQSYVAPIGSAPTPERDWRRLVEATERVQWVHYGADGRFIFSGRDVGGDENTQIFRSLPTGAELVALTPPRVKTMFGTLSHDGRQIAFASNQRNPGDFDIYVRPVGEGEARRVVEATGSRTAVAFSPDGARLVVQEERSNFDHELVLVDLASGQARTLTAHPGAGEIRFESPRFTADGRALWLISDRDRDFANLAVLPLDGGAMRFVQTESHDLDALEVSPDGALLAGVYNVEGYGQLRVYEGTPDALRERPRPQLPPGVVSSMSFSRDGATLFVGLSRAVSADEVYRVDTRTGAATQVTQSDLAGLDPARLVEPTVERVRSFDGLEIPVFLYRPRDLAPGERAPVVVWVHGGPEAQFTPYFSQVIQYLVGHGYIVAAPNVRGSTGYGKRYSHLDDVALREDSVRDLGAVNQWLRGRPDVRPDRIGVLGGSYGGYMVLAALTLQPELWAAGCDIVGIANFRTFLERTAPYRRALREAEYGALARDGEVLDRVSPIHRVDRIRAPLFVIHGANDPRVPVHEAEQIVAALRARQQRVEYVRFENEGHGIFRRENKVRAYGELVRFFDEVLGR